MADVAEIADMATKIRARGRHTQGSSPPGGRKLNIFIYLQHLQHLQRSNKDGVFCAWQTWQTYRICGRPSYFLGEAAAAGFEISAASAFAPERLSALRRQCHHLPRLTLR